MTITTELYVTHPDLGLAPTIRSLDDAELGVVPDASTAPGQRGYCYWVDAADFEAVESALETDHTVATYSRLSAQGNRQLYRIEFTADAELLSPAVLERDGLMVETRSHRDGWLVKLQLHEHRVLHELYEDATARDITVEVLEITNDEAVPADDSRGLTPSQAEALVAAYEHGYYDEPRDTSLEELAAVLGISPTAVSGRLRRGSARLIEQRLGEDERPPD